MVLLLDHSSQSYAARAQPWQTRSRLHRLSARHSTSRSHASTPQTRRRNHIGTETFHWGRQCTGFRHCRDHSFQARMHQVSATPFWPPAHREMQSLHFGERVCADRMRRADPLPFPCHAGNSLWGSELGFKFMMHSNLILQIM